MAIEAVVLVDHATCYIVDGCLPSGAKAHQLQRLLNKEAMLAYVLPRCPSPKSSLSDLPQPKYHETVLSR